MFGVNLSDRVGSFCVKVLQDLTVHLLLVVEQASVFVKVSRERLVENIVSENVRIASKLGCDCGPIISEAVLDTVFIFPEILENRRDLWRRVKLHERSFAALLREWEPSLKVDWDFPIIERLTETHHPRECSAQRPRTLMVKTFVFREIKSWHSFTADPSRKHILVRVDNRVDSLLSQTVNQSLYLVQVGLIVNPWLFFYRFPDHSKAHDVRTPVLKLLDFVIRQRHLDIEGLPWWEIGWDLHDNILPVEHLNSAGAVDEA